MADDHQPDSLLSALASASPLFAGFALLMLGNGLQGSLIGIRASQENFGAILIGVIMAAFFIGFLAGSWWTPRALRKVGHIRVFAALASIASVAILIQAVRVMPITWLLMRFVTGLCYAGIFVVAESWLNHRATNTTRGRLLATYMVIMYLGMAGGQFLLNMADPGSAYLFIVASVLISVSVVPLLLSASQGPDATSPTPMPLRRLIRISPFGTMGIFIAGVINGTVFGMGAVYAHKAGLSVAQVAVFMAALIGGGAVLQWPIGRLSDHCDRRLVIIGVAFVGAAAAMLADRVTGWSTAWMASGVGLFGGLAFTIHSLNLARTNDCLYPNEMLNASGALVLLLGMGSILGPLVVGVLMHYSGPSAFFYWLAGTLILFGLFGIGCWRYYVKRPDTARAPYVAVPGQPSIVTSIAVEDASATHEEVESTSTTYNDPTHHELP